MCHNLQTMKRYFLLPFFLFSGFPIFSQVIINEYSCSNISTVTDNYGQNEDWIELFNTSGSAVNLTGFYLSDKATNPTKWQIPSGTIAAGGYMMVYCSGRNEFSGGNLHTGFKLTQTKPEEIVLANTSGTIIEQITLNPTQTNHSRGRTTNGASAWSLFTTPTPNASNTGDKLEYAQRPSMSQPQGYYTGTISITITANPADQINYTTDGSEPTSSSTLYTGPISISATTVLRAKAFSSNPQVPPSFIESNTYFINVNHTVPVISIFGTDLPSLLAGSYGDPDVVCEYFDRNKVYKTEAAGTANKHGNDSWAYDQRGIDFVAIDEQGYNYALEEKLFARKDRDKFQRIILKPAANDNYPFEGGAHIRDAYVHTLSQDGDLALDERTYEPCIMYANGQYWGVYEIREKVDDHDFTDYYYNQDEWNLYYLKTWGGTWSEYGGAAAQADWDALRNFINSNNMAVQANYDYVDSLYNVKSLVDYFALNSYVVTSDWLNWNTAWWRGIDPAGDKKKWRYTLWDMDATFGHYINYTGIPDQSPAADPCDPESLPDPGGQGHVELLNKLRENPGFDNFYITRYIDLTNTVFSCDNMINKLDSCIAVITPEMPGQIAKWGGTMAGWQANVNTLRTFIDTRCTAIQQGFLDCYNLTGPYTITINVDPPGSGNVRINSLQLDTYPWNATYYGGITNELEATAVGNYVFDYWEMVNTANPSPNDSLITVNFSSNDNIIAHFKTPQAFFIPTAFSPNGDGINDFLVMLGEGIISVNLDVYNRWGEVVFQTTNPLDKWDGKFKGQDQQSGVYAYKVYVVLSDGTELNQSGNITLMR